MDIIMTCPEYSVGFNLLGGFNMQRNLCLDLLALVSTVFTPGVDITVPFLRLAHFLLMGRHRTLSPDGSVSFSLVFFLIFSFLDVL